MYNQKNKKKSKSNQVSQAGENKFTQNSTMSPSLQEINELLLNYSSGKFDLAKTNAKVLTIKYPKHPFAWKALGTILQQIDRPQDALVSIREAVLLGPKDAAAHNNLGNILRDLGHYSEAEISYRQAIALKPDFAEARSNLGNALQDLGRCSEAEISCRQAIALKPDFAEARSNLGNALRDLGRYSEAEISYRQAIALKPDYALFYSNLGNAVQDLGRYSEAEISYRRAMALKPDFAEANSNLLFSLNYADLSINEERIEEAKKYGLKVSERAIPKFLEWNAVQQPKRLRIGFVSGDLKNHPVGYFIEGLISHLDREKFALFAFSATPVVDELTSRVKPYFQKWLPIYGMSDFEAAGTIHQNEIDILVDLSGHTSGNRLPVFSYKPAPVQVSWLGYFATTGLPEMDYLLGDPYVTPQSEAHHFSEKVWQLPETYLCFNPPSEQTLVSLLPALQNGFITFGCFNNLSKMSKEVVEVWGAILQAIPNSKLFLKTKQLNDSRIVAEVYSKFAVHGIASDRLLLEGSSPRAELLAAYNRVDIALDPFPYPGGTTSVEAVWMGVPVLTLKGNRFLSHVGETIAHNIGHPEWIAKDLDDYVNKVISFASDIENLVDLRMCLRDKALKSPLFNAEQFTNHFGKALQEMWLQYLQDTKK